MTKANFGVVTLLLFNMFYFIMFICEKKEFYNNLTSSLNHQHGQNHSLQSNLSYS